MTKIKLSLENKNYKISLEDINKFEKKLKIILPHKYKEFLIKNNGGKVKNPYSVFFKSKYYDESIYIDSFFELIELKDINKNIYGLNPSKNKFIAIADDYLENKRAIFISLSEKEYGKIFINYSSSTSLNENQNDDFILIADDFEQLVTNFHKIENFEFESMCENGQFKEAIQLIKDGLDVNSLNDENQKLIIIATNQWHQDLDLIKSLVENGSDVNEIYDVSRHSPLTLSVIMGDSIDVVKYLIEKGADINHKDEISEKTAIEHAEERMQKNPNLKFVSDMFDILKKANEEQKNSLL